MLKAGKSSVHESMDDENKAEELLITEYVATDNWREADLPETKQNKTKQPGSPSPRSYHLVFTFPTGAESLSSLSLYRS